MSFAMFFGLIGIFAILNVVMWCGGCFKSSHHQNGPPGSGHKDLRLCMDCCGNKNDPYRGPSQGFREKSSYDLSSRARLNRRNTRSSEFREMGRQARSQRRAQGRRQREEEEWVDHDLGSEKENYQEEVRRNRSKSRSRAELADFV
ncbi:hypothetical protein T439DRAFT_360797 [Meredithblackwellia eburnea MCA 4105]